MLVSKLRRMFARRRTRKPAPATKRPRLGVEAMEARDCPATMAWVNLTGNGQFNVAQNWVLVGEGPGKRTPLPGDDVHFNNNVGNCTGFAGGTYQSVQLTVPITVALSGPVMTKAFHQIDGSFDLTSSTPLTVSGPASTETWPTAWFNWKGGTLDSTPATPSDVYLTGGTASITSGGATAPQAGGRLNFQGSVVANIANVTLQFNSARTIFVDGSSTLNVTNAVINAVDSNAEPLTLKDAQEKVYLENTTAHSLGVYGGTATIKGRSTVTFTKTLPPSTFFSVVQEKGALVIENGSTLDAGTRQVLITGGLLATKAVGAAGNPNDPEPNAVIKASQVQVGGTQGFFPVIRISAQEYRPDLAGSDHRYAKLQVKGDIHWLSGQYEPTISTDDTKADVWDCDNRFYIKGGGAVVTPQEVGTGLRTIGHRFTVMSAFNGFWREDAGDPALPSVTPTFNPVFGWKAGTAYTNVNLTQGWQIERLR